MDYYLPHASPDCRIVSEPFKTDRLLKQSFRDEFQAILPAMAAALGG
jgi:hypothetical protein